MTKLNIKWKIVFTNWISVVGIILTVYVAGIIGELISTTKDGDVLLSIWVGVVGGIIGLILYGTLFFLGFIISMIILDFLLIGESSNNLRIKLLIQWVLISAPFTYWLIMYNQWIFLVAILTFLVTQIIRERLILKLLKPNKKSSLE